MATVVIGYTVIRFGDAESTSQIEAKVHGDESITAEDLATVTTVSPAAGTEATEGETTGGTAAKLTAASDTAD